MHELSALSPLAQAKLFLLMDDIVDIHFMAMDDYSSLGGYGVAELEPYESQERGFQHGHRKKYVIPKNNERAIIENFRTHNETELHNLFQYLKNALIRCAETLQYEASTLPAKPLGPTVLPDKFTAKQQKQYRLVGGVELWLTATAPSSDSTRTALAS